MKQNLLVTNIGRLVTMEPKRGRDGPLGVIENAVLFAQDGRISWFGSKALWKKLSSRARQSFPLPRGERVEGEGRFFKELRMFDAKGGVVTPGLIDCHTHLVHAGSRQNEFLLRSQGKTYWEIAQAGGGIMSTVRATRAAKFDELYEISRERADEALKFGTTTMEVKSGYGLDLNTELKILEVAKKIDANHQINICPTFLGAHVVPQEYKNRRKDYVNLVIDKMLPAVAKKKLARFADVFVEEGAFTAGEAGVIAKAANKYGMRVKLHVDQFKDGGGGELAALLNAISADHLDYVSDRGIEAMQEANVVAVLLPGATFFTGGRHHVPARKMIDKGVRVAIATDYNPGTNPCLDLILTATMAVTQMGLTVDEAWRGITINAAASLGIEKDFGTIAVGKRADIVIFDAQDEYYVIYRYGKNRACAVSVNGCMHFIDARKFS